MASAKVISYLRGSDVYLSKMGCDEITSSFLLDTDLFFNQSAHLRLPYLADSTCEHCLHHALKEGN